MAAIDLNQMMKQYGAVQPRTGFPVQNQGGMPRYGTTAPPKPFLTQPTVAAPPGPAPMTSAAPVSAPPMPAGPYGKVSGVSVSAPQAPAPASTPASPGGKSTASSGQTDANKPVQGPLQQQLLDYISKAFEGSVSPEFIQRAKEQVFRNVSGQTAQGASRINEDAIRRGLFRSGIPAEGIANLQGAAQGAMASGVADILNSAEAQNIQGRQAAAGTAGELLSQNRQWQQYLDSKKKAGGGGGPTTFTYIDPETGQSYQMDESWF